MSSGEGRRPGHDGVGLGFLQCAIDVLAQLGVVVDNFHATAAEHVARTDQHRVSDGVRGLAGLVQAQRGAVARRVHVGLLQHLAEELTVFGQINGFRRGAENRNACGLQSAARDSGVWPPSWTMTPLIGPIFFSAS